VERTLEELVAGCRGNVERIGKLLADAERELERLLTARRRAPDDVVAARRKLPYLASTNTSVPDPMLFRHASPRVI
jgi:hypothetical protein